MNLAALPNLICGVRILIVVPVGWAILGGRYETALVLFVIAAVSDALDGFLARRYGWITELGQILDPTADKLLLVTVFVALAVGERVPAWLCLAAVARDAIIALGALAYRQLCRSWGVGATFVSKLNTTLQLGYLSAGLAEAAAPRVLAPPVLTALGAATFVTTVISGLDYVLTYARLAARAGAAG